MVFHSTTYIDASLSQPYWSGRWAIDWASATFC